MKLSPDERIAGVLAPLFALRTEEDLGIGDVAGLRQFIDWARRLGFKLVQLLPINETGGDNSPYNAISSLAIELAPHRIRVNAICPAGMITNFGLAPGAAPRAPATRAQLESYGKLHPLGSVIEPIDAAEAALFLASSRSKNITGVLLPVDGGYTAA